MRVPYISELSQPAKQRLENCANRTSMDEETKRRYIEKKSGNSEIALIEANIKNKKEGSVDIKFSNESTINVTWSPNGVFVDEDSLFRSLSMNMGAESTRIHESEISYTDSCDTSFSANDVLQKKTIDFWSSKTTSSQQQVIDELEAVYNILPESDPSKEGLASAIETAKKISNMGKLGINLLGL